MEILLPRIYNSKNIHKEISLNRPLVFLAGPVRGGGWWQMKMAKLLEERMPNCIVAIPCRWETNHPLAPHFISSTDQAFSRQLFWERFYLEEAGAGNIPGCILFWLGCESTEFPHPGPESYAMDTRREIGKWGYRFAKEYARVVFGAEDNFYGLNVIQEDISQDVGHPVGFWKSMEDTATAAALAIRKSVRRE